MENMEKKRVHIFVSGKVQGVFYRATTQRKALELGLAGWVRNLSDGRVELVAEGDSADVEALEKWCQKGPAQAYVVEMDVKSEDPTGEFSDFAILYS